MKFLLHVEIDKVNFLYKFSDWLNNSKLSYAFSKTIKKQEISRENSQRTNYWSKNAQIFTSVSCNASLHSKSQTVSLS